MKLKPASALLIAALVSAAPAAADWLVTRAGGRVETKGPWTVKGKLVVFNRTDGTLASLRLSEVDLEASRKATADAQAQAAAPAAPEPPKKKLASLTDADFRRQPPAAATETAATPSAPSGPLTVSSWKRIDSPGGEGVQLEGTLHNNTDDLMVNAAIEVQLFDEVGNQVGTAAAVLSTSSLQPKGTVDFRASFPGVFAYTEVKFEPKGLPLDVSPAPEEPEPPAAPPR